MPNFTGSQKSSTSKKQEVKAPAKRPVSGTTATAVQTAPARRNEPELDDEDLEELQSRGKKKMSPFLIAVPIVVVVVFVVFIAVFRTLNRPVAPASNNEPASSSIVEPQVSNPPSSASSASGGTSTAEDGGTNPSEFGTQDFSQNTNMQSTTPLTNPNQFLDDIYGLTTEADYTVKDIQSANDFVSYTKKRGTWKGGLELYWLEADFQGRPYVIQVPFKYYKELTETGIVPVKMEVLRILGSDGEQRTIISYMCLDEETLKTVLKSQSK